MTFKTPFGIQVSSMTGHTNLHNSHELAVRKQEHIELTSASRTGLDLHDSRFNYEPLFFTHPIAADKWSTEFLNFTLDYPVWISSMTGGTGTAKEININLAKLCGEFKLGMGLGSCRPLLSNKNQEDFSVRKYLGSQPLFANLGMAQVEELVAVNQVNKIIELVKSIEADGLIIHLNPLQEWLQPGGDRYVVSPLETLARFLDAVRFPVMVKEVGQGLGPKSLKALLELPLAGIEFAAFGGTNFSLLESKRGATPETKQPFIHVGHSAYEMVEMLNALPTREKQFIISGGIKSVLDGYELKLRLKAPAVIGMASAFLAPARTSYEELQKHFLNVREALLVARGLLTLKEHS